MICACDHDILTIYHKIELTVRKYAPQCTIVNTDYTRSSRNDI